MYDWSFARRSRGASSAARRARRSARSGRSRAASAPARRANASSSAKRKLPLQRMHGFGVSPRRVAAHERLDDGAPELLAQVERDVRQAEPVARGAGGEHGLRRAAGALGVGAVRIEPEPESDADRLAARRVAARPRCRRRRSSRRRRDPGAGSARKTGPSAFASASTASSSPPTAAASSSVKPLERTLETFGLGADDPVALDAEPHERPASRPGSNRRSASPCGQAR